VRSLCGHAVVRSALSEIGFGGFCVLEPSHYRLCCELCEGWFHTKCVGVSKDCYEALKIVPGSHWFCDSCNIKVSDVIQSMLRTNQRLDQVI